MNNKPILRQLRIYSLNKKDPAKSRFFSCLHLIFPILFFAVFLSIGDIKVAAAPLHNVPLTLIQPDNTEINCFASGDEFFNYYHDAEGYLIIKNDDTGYYTYAQIVDGNIVGSNNIVNARSSAQMKTAKNNRITVADIPQEYIEEQYESNGAYDNTLTTMDYESEKQEPARGQTFTPINKFINKTVQNLVIFVKFSDTVDDWPSANDALLYSDYLLGTSGGPSLQGYINEVSYGKTQINSILGGSTYTEMYKYTDNHKRGWYTLWPETHDVVDGLLKKAYESVANDVPSDVNLDGNDDGKIDCVTFIVWGDTTGWNTALWSRMSVFPSDFTNITINGKTLEKYIMVVQGNTGSGHRVFAHEMLHVLGFPDLYRHSDDEDLDYTQAPVGAWDMMSNNTGHPNAHTKLKYGGWIDEMDEITTPGSYTINPLTSSTNNSKIIRSPFNSNEYIMVEYRNEEGNYEDGIPGTGLLIYKINRLKNGNSRATANDPKGDKCEVFVYRPFNGNTYGSYLNAHFSSDVGRTYANEFNSDPILEYDNGVSSGIFISNIGPAGDTISFDVRFQLFSDPRVEQAVRTAINKPTGDLTPSDLAQVTELAIPGDTTEINLEGVEFLENLERIYFSGNAYVSANNTAFSYGNRFEFDTLSVVSGGISLDNVFVTINKYSSQNALTTTESDSVSLSGGLGTYSPVSSVSYLNDAAEHLELLLYLDSDYNKRICRQIVKPILFEFD